ncbi:MAG: hypothetical protein A4E45_01156 [Methanosaeta sp. PtaB.Bin039]|nr:MAG: hypothetical protein A4E45_01156 [Methanosaeta sp. PtaB.Bin039]HQJ27767.1 DUF2551 domain-containing protein [Methanotrichaceae archaeon]
MSKKPRPEIWDRLIHFLDLDKDGLRRLVMRSIVDCLEFTVGDLHQAVCRHLSVSRRVIASMIGYICSRLGLLHVNKPSYRQPTIYVLKEQYLEMARSALDATAQAGAG